MILQYKVGANIYYIRVSPSNDSGVDAALGVLVLVGQSNSLNVVAEGEWSFDLQWKRFLAC